MKKKKKLCVNRIIDISIHPLTEYIDCLKV